MNPARLTLLRRLTLIGLLVIAGISGSVRPAAAKTDLVFTPEVPLPGFNTTMTVGEDFTGKYLRVLYIYIVGAIMVAAVAMIVFGGIRWIVAAGNPGQITAAKDTVQNAIIGVIIALTSYLLLNLIDPSFVNIGIPSLKNIKKDYFSGAIAKDICPADAGIECGQMLKRGTILIDQNTGLESPSGKKKDKYCMGTICKHNIVGSTIGRVSGVNEDQVCVIGKSPTTGFFTPGAGCQDTIPFSAESPRPDPLLQNLEVKIVGGKCGWYFPLGTSFLINPLALRGNTAGANCQSFTRGVIGAIPIPNIVPDNRGCYTTEATATMKPGFAWGYTINHWCCPGDTSCK